MFVCISHGWADVCSTEGQKVLSLQDLKCQSWFWCFSLAQMSHLLTLIYFHRMKSFCLVKNMRGETKLMKRAVMLWRFCYTHSHAQHAVKWLAVLWLHVHLPVYIYIQYRKRIHSGDAMVSPYSTDLQVAVMQQYTNKGREEERKLVSTRYDCLSSHICPKYMGL